MFFKKKPISFGLSDEFGGSKAGQFVRCLIEPDWDVVGEGVVGVLLVW